MVWERMGVRGHATALPSAWGLGRVLGIGFSSCAAPAYCQSLSILCGLRVEVQGPANSMVCWSSVLRIKSEV